MATLHITCDLNEKNKNFAQAIDVNLVGSFNAQSKDFQVEIQINVLVNPDVALVDFNTKPSWFKAYLGPNKYILHAQQYPEADVKDGILYTLKKIDKKTNELLNTINNCQCEIETESLERSHWVESVYVSFQHTVNLLDPSFGLLRSYEQAGFLPPDSVDKIKEHFLFNENYNHWNQLALDEISRDTQNLLLCRSVLKLPRDLKLKLLTDITDLLF